MKINVSEPEILFDIHFLNNSNKRILFSGKYGSGKTYFLKEFFDRKKKKFNTFWLSPVKYSVSQNEDIFEYIKFDLALKLIGMPEFDKIVKTKFTEFEYLSHFLSNQPLVAVETLFSLLETLANKDSPEKEGLSLVAGSKKALELLMNSYEKYKQFKKNIEESVKEEIGIFKTYLKDNSLTKGSIFEDDLITQTIRSALQVCKFQGKKDNILIIDDFDRLDPEHVFRILNILSVHNEMYDDSNKFGFDKVIIVCDYENISSIYSHKYGDQINFLGYISKFYSTDVFHFSNKLAIQHYFKTQLGVILNNQNVQDVLGLILAYFVDKNKLTIRDIIKIKIPHNINSFIFGPYKIWDNPKEFKSYNTRVLRSESFIAKDNNDFFISSNDYPLLSAIRILSVIFGGYSNLKSTIMSLNHDNDQDLESIYYNKIIKSYIILLNHAKLTEPQYLFFSYTGDNHQFQVTLDRPMVRAYNLNISIPTGWSTSNLYRSEHSYYEKVNENMESIDFSKLDNVTILTYKVLFRDFLAILNFLERSSKIGELGLTKLNF